MTTVHAFLAETDASQYDVFLAWVCEMMEMPEESLQGTVTESMTSCGPVACAVDAGRTLAALTWLDDGPDRYRYEAFFARPASLAPRIGLRIMGGGFAPCVPDVLSQWFADSCAVSPSKVPSFLKLACLLSGRGVVVHDTSAELANAEAERDYLKQLLDEQSDALRQSNARLRALRQSFADGALPPPDGGAHQVVEEEDGLPDLAQWCAEHEQEIVVLPRARNGAKKSIYETPLLIFQALELLAGPYRQAKLKEADFTVFETGLREHGLELSGSTTRSVAGEQGDAYFVRWAGKKRFLELHLRKGGGRDERFSFRLYFFWDADSGRVVVGSMPAHLANTLS